MKQKHRSIRMGEITLRLGFTLLAVSSSLMLCGCDKHENSPLAELVRHSLRPVTRGCMAHVGASESDLEHIRQDPPYPRNTACIMKCLFEKIGLVKNGKFSKQGFLAVITPLVMANKKKMEHMKCVADTCDKEIDTRKSKDCDVGNEIVTCIFKHAPELHIKI